MGPNHSSTHVLRPELGFYDVTQQVYPYGRTRMGPNNTSRVHKLLFNSSKYSTVQTGCSSSSTRGSSSSSSSRDNLRTFQNRRNNNNNNDNNTGWRKLF